MSSPLAEAACHLPTLRRAVKDGRPRLIAPGQSTLTDGRRRAVRIWPIAHMVLGVIQLPGSVPPQIWRAALARAVAAPFSCPTMPCARSRLMSRPSAPAFRTGGCSVSGSRRRASRILPPAKFWRLGARRSGTISRSRRVSKADSACPSWSTTTWTAWPSLSCATKTCPASRISSTWASTRASRSASSWGEATAARSATPVTSATAICVSPLTNGNETRQAQILVSVSACARHSTPGWPSAMLSRRSRPPSRPSGISRRNSGPS